MSAPLPIKVAPRAQAQIEGAAAWWAQNRPAAPGAIRNEFSRILTIISTQPGIGLTERRGRIRGLRRLNLSRIDYYILAYQSQQSAETMSEMPPNHPLQRTSRKRHAAERRRWASQLYMRTVESTRTNIL